MPLPNAGTLSDDDVLPFVCSFVCLLQNF